MQSTSVPRTCRERAGASGRKGAWCPTAPLDGSLVLYGELAKRGASLTIVRPRDSRIDLADFERAVRGDTRLVAISLVSWYNGFQHDLKAVCDIAHAKGAHVYADVIQAAGNTPIDVRATGVDFLACSTFKWLMGDFGIGFLYVREDLLDRVVRRTQIGYGEADEVMLHYLPSDPPGDTPVTWTLRGTRAALRGRDVRQAAVNALSVSLPWLAARPREIQAHRRPLLERLHEEMPRRGFTLDHAA